MGAPKGNTNALKHGLYANRYSPEEMAGIRKMLPDDYRHEIYLMRVTINNLFTIHSRLFRKIESGESVDTDGLAKISNSLSLAITALNTTARTYALFSGTDTSLNDPLDEVLDSLPIFLDDKYLTEGNEEVGGEILVEGGKNQETKT